VIFIVRVMMFSLFLSASCLSWLSDWMRIRDHILETFLILSKYLPMSDCLGIPKKCSKMYILS